MVTLLFVFQRCTWKPRLTDTKMSYGSIAGGAFGRNAFGGPKRQGYQPVGKHLLLFINQNVSHGICMQPELDILLLLHGFYSALHIVLNGRHYGWVGIQFFLVYRGLSTFISPKSRKENNVVCIDDP